MQKCEWVTLVEQATDKFRSIFIKRPSPITHPPVHQADIVEVDAVKDKQADIGILESSFLHKEDGI